MRRIAGIAFFIAVFASLIAIYSIDGLRWRAAVLAAKFAGQIPEIPLRDLFVWLRPGSPVSLYSLATNPNPNAMLTNPDRSEQAEGDGKQIYSMHCGHCHGSGAEGYTGPSLIAALSSGISDWSFFSTVRWGRAGTAMEAQSLTEQEIWKIHAYLQKLALEETRAYQAAEARGKVQPARVSFEAILDAHNHPADWLTFSGNYAGQRHTELTSITKENVSSLRIEWAAQLRSADVSLEASPVVHQGRMYVSESPDGLVSLDAGTGQLLWRFRRPLPSSNMLCCGSFNRGVAILDDSLYLGTIDSHLLSVDAETGQKRWEVEVAKSTDGYSMTGAPLALSNKIVVGVAGGELGIRGFISAFRPSDGQRLWTFHTVPEPGEAGHETWGGDSWKTGGAPTWATGSYEPHSGTIFWGTGNPSPVYDAEKRPGDNLYSNSIVALSENDGSLRWHYQFSPGDDHDWDATEQPVLADIPWEGKQRSVVLFANRNGFFYVLDRKTGQFLLAKSFVKQTWNDGFQSDGKPIVRKDAHPSRTGRLVWPSVVGGTNWWPPSFDAKRLLLFVPTVESADMYFREDAASVRGDSFLGSTSQHPSGMPATVAIKAIDVTSGQVRWESPLAKGTISVVKKVGGVLSTSSGVVFVGYRDEFLALDADTGKVLRRIRVGGKFGAPPIAYEVDGHQFIAVLAGNSLFAFAVPQSK